MSKREPEFTDDYLDRLLAASSIEDVVAMVASMNDDQLAAATLTLGISAADMPLGPLGQAQEIDPAYRGRAHLTYLSERLSLAVTAVEGGTKRFMRISMPPRMGKSFLTSVWLPIWILRKHPDWKIGLISHSPALASSWGRQVRRVIEARPDLGIELASDAGAVTDWETTKGGGVRSRSIGQSITGLGFKVLLMDDLVKDFAAAHSEGQRDALWDWWIANAFTRLEPPSLAIAIGTRWHEDDFLGRLSSHEYEGNPDDWEIVEFPALAETNDVLGRSPGEPLLSPIIEETPEEALARWADIRTSVGSYNWSALYQQAPAPSKGNIFDIGWLRYWNDNPDLCDGETILHLTPEAVPHARWLDSWDCAFKGTDSSDYVVGQRWFSLNARRVMVWQTRERLTFTQTVARMKKWANPDATIEENGAPFTAFVPERLVEDKANGTAIIDTLKSLISGIIPVNPTESKEARARAVTPEFEAGNVVLPDPRMQGYEWVVTLVDELRNFPTGAHDDQVDALTQAISRMRTGGGGQLLNPAMRSRPITRAMSSGTRAIGRAGGR